MKKAFILPLTIVILFFTVSCSKDDDLTKVNLKLTATKTIIQPFESFKVELNIKEFEAMRSDYDSILWYANGHADYNFSFFAPLYLGDLGNSLIKSMDITDYNLGSHKVYVRGYKDGNILSSDSIEYTVQLKNSDFLCINWGGKEENKYFISNQTPLLKNNGFKLMLAHTVKSTDKDENVKITYTSWSTNRHSDPQETQEERQARIDKEIVATRKLFHDYITSVYGNSILHYEGDDARQTNLIDGYNMRFKTSLASGEYPVEIWETATSNICLASLYTGWYYIIAEPKLKN